MAATPVQTGYGEREGQAPRALDIEKPLGTVVSGTSKHALVSAFLAKHYTGVVGSDLEEPIGTVTSTDHHSLVSACLVGVGARAGQSRPRGIEEPTATVTAKYDTALVTSNLIKLRGTSTAAATDEPLATVSAGGQHHAEVRAFLLSYYGTDQAPQLDGPLATITSRDRFGLVTIHGQDYQIVDIGLRMLMPRELFRAQGFPEHYIIGDDAAQGLQLTKSAQVRMCGNSVCPPMAKALIVANFAHEKELAYAAA
ncbi:C-5 cytosine-specific DNA methylase [Caballeronia sordidicola]|uniref:C-5 cytosine-specific DNA methylase n=1 Tax=Caballeronia sordidicola TaxID=196367 RepID=A0A158G156_CABSO|nr:C-5 cytosine-specific DNA methylase [Caballeronia sordidicola]